MNQVLNDMIETVHEQQFGNVTRIAVINESEDWKLEDSVWVKTN